MIPAPDARLRFDPARLGLRPAARAFFRRETVEVARDLIGAWFARRRRGRWYGGRIVETEAYIGPGDAAAHSWKGRRTPRVEPMYWDGGTLYVFFVYGMHYCANVVTRRPGDPQAVLLRAAEPPDGAPPRLLAGPARLCAALGVTRSASGMDLVEGEEFHIFLARGARPAITVSPRIGVDYAGEAAAWPLRFFDAESEAVSVKPKTRERPSPQPSPAGRGRTRAGARSSSGSRRPSRGGGRSS
jgi:DNA-3-methyladenine glycosylase